MPTICISAISNGKKSFDELAKMEKKAVLFVMTDDTRNCDEEAAFLEARYPELNGSVLVIHTKNCVIRPIAGTDSDATRAAFRRSRAVR
jgi:hypothetical protein